MLEFLAVTNILAHEKRWDDLVKFFQLVETFLAIPGLDAQVQAAAARLAGAEANLPKPQE